MSRCPVSPYALLLVRYFCMLCRVSISEELTFSSSGAMSVGSKYTNFTKVPPISIPNQGMLAVVWKFRLLSQEKYLNVTLLTRRNYCGICIVSIRYPVFYAICCETTLRLAIRRHLLMCRISMCFYKNNIPAILWAQHRKSSKFV